MRSATATSEARMLRIRRGLEAGPLEGGAGLQNKGKR